MQLIRLIKLYLSKTCSEARKGKHSSDTFPIQNGLKQGDVLLPMLSTSSL
jgi:hypothetical protein